MDVIEEQLDDAAGEAFDKSEDTWIAISRRPFIDELRKKR